MLLTLQTDHSSWSSKAFWPPPSPEELKKIFIDQGIKIENSRSCANLKQKSSSHLHDRDTSGTKMSTTFSKSVAVSVHASKIDPFRKNLQDQRSATTAIFFPPC
ncbi:hypothetical protein TNCV_1768851 [Trichonephila clavipes]|nr:hypothetical protein TNCV_1768851 [Trichonephila clavipes]